MKKILGNTFLVLVFCSALLSCKQENGTTKDETSKSAEAIAIAYAKGFAIEDKGNYKVLSIIDPWPGADRSYRYAMVNRDLAPKIGLMRDEYEGIVLTPVESLIVTSTTHIAALELLDAQDRLIGFPGTDYVSSERTRKRIENNLVRELGKNEGINTEVLLSIKPEVVVGFGVDGTNKTFNTIKNANIPVLYNGDWTEGSPLAKAEWIKFFGILFEKESQADSIFKNIEQDYNNAKLLASEVSNRPTVLSGALHKDVWYLPNGTSPEAQFLKDANADYLWSETSGSGSLALNFENVLEKAQDADLWLSPSYYTSLEALEQANPHYTKFKAFEKKQVYSFSMTTGATGGVLYYELGMARPDLVLKDIIKICHPDLLEDHDPFFFKPLQ